MGQTEERSGNRHVKLWGYGIRSSLETCHAMPAWEVGAGVVGVGKQGHGGERHTHMKSRDRGECMVVGGGSESYA